MAGFVVFCLLVAAIVAEAGIAITFAAATAAAVWAQAAVAVAMSSTYRAGLPSYPRRPR